MVKTKLALRMLNGWVLLILLCVSNASFGQEAERISPKLFRGQVVEMDESPIADAAVRCVLVSWDEVFENRTVHAKGKLNSGEDGSFEFVVPKAIPLDRELYLNVSVGTKLHFSRSFDFGDESIWKESVEVGNLKLDRGVHVKGQLVSPDGSTEKLENPTVSLHCDDGLKYGSRRTRFYRDLVCDEDGRFQCLVPNNKTLSLSFGAENFAPSKTEKEIKLPVATGRDDIPELDLGSIKLENGVSVVGTAKLHDGSPAKGVVIAILGWAGKGSDFQVKSDRFEYQRVGHRAFVKTDAQGKFRMPPLQGKCTLLALRQGSSRTLVDGEAQTIVTDGDVPFIKPFDVDLDGKGREVIVKLQEVESVEISGTVYDAKDKPVSKARIHHGWYCIFGPIGHRTTWTDKDGKYRFRMGKGFRPSIDLLHVGQEKTFVTAETVEDNPDLFFGSGRLESPEFNFVTKDVSQLNWELLPPKNRSAAGRVGRAVKWLFSDQ